MHSARLEDEESKDPGQQGKDQRLKNVGQLIDLTGSMSAARAVYLHGLAGDIARDLYGGDSMIATDIIHSLGDAFDLCERESRDKFVYLQR